MSEGKGTLAARQKAGETLEARVIDVLLNLPGAQKLTVSDVKFIAAMARNYAFNLFSAAESPRP